MPNPNESLLLELLKQVIEVLENHKITYWLDGGTLLGAVRDGKFIDWDNDIDIGSWDMDYKRDVKKLISLSLIDKGLSIGLYENNMNIRKGQVCVDVKFYLLKNNNAVEPKFMPRNTIGKILYILSKSLIAPNHISADHMKSFYGSTAVKLSNLITQAIPLFMRPGLSKLMMAAFYQFGSEDITEVVPAIFFKYFSNMTFYGMTFKVPEKTEQYLVYRYGTNWLTPVKDWVTERDDGSIRNYTPA